MCIDSLRYALLSSFPMTIKPSLHNHFLKVRLRRLWIVLSLWLLFFKFVTKNLINPSKIVACSWLPIALWKFYKARLCIKCSVPVWKLSSCFVCWCPAWCLPEDKKARSSGKVQSRHVRARTSLRAASSRRRASITFPVADKRWACRLHRVTS